MATLIIQLAVLVFLASWSARLWLSIRRQRGDSWQAILRRVRYRGRPVCRLSYCLLVSADLHCPEREVWEEINGVKGVYTIAWNAGVLGDAIDYLESYGAMKPSAPDRLDGLKKEAATTQKTALLCLLLYSRPLAVKSVKAYLGLVSNLNVLLWDHHPELVADYCDYVARA